MNQANRLRKNLGIFGTLPKLMVQLIEDQEKNGRSKIQMSNFHLFLKVTVANSLDNMQTRKLQTEKSEL